MKKAIYNPSVRLLLVPLPAIPQAAASSDNAPKFPLGDGLSRNQRKKLHKQEREAKTRQDRQRQTPPPPAKRQKGDGKGKSNFELMSGKAKTTSSGDPICFNYNIRGCPNAQPGAKCPRGWHLCAEQGCQKPHPMTEHRS